ncbi:hypothetical protein [Aeromicrobium sp. NPDC092404]|uniref:hypothetical protein n=1 Tax=Aeromicrobium sp. NPDC092404 TaxID=3154976 RepID=UPI00342F84BC
MSRRPAVLVRVVVAVALLALLAVDVRLSVVRDNREEVESARTEALASARKRVPAVLSYHHRSLDADLARATRQLTGPFRRDFSELVRSTVEPAARKSQIVTKAVVRSAGIVRAKSDKVVVLLLVNQQTSTKSQTAPRIDGSRVQVTMQRKGSSWFVAAIKPV